MATEAMKATNRTIARAAASAGSATETVSASATSRTESGAG